MNTIEQELDERYPIHEDMSFTQEQVQIKSRHSFLHGAKWAQQQPTDKLYTKEDLKSFFGAGMEHGVSPYLEPTFEDWFKERFGQ